MQDLASKLFDGAVGAANAVAGAAIKGVEVAVVAVGAPLEAIVNDPTMQRMAVQGKMEAASALFNHGDGNTFVAYGPGQNLPKQEVSQDAQKIEPPQQERGGLSM